MNTLIKKQIRPIIEQIVAETFNREMIKIRASILSYVSKTEQKDIEKRYKKPSGKAIKTIRARI